MNVSFWIDNKEFRLSLTQMKRNDLQVSLGRKNYHDEILLNVNGKIYNVIISSNTTSYFVYVNERCFRIEKKSARQILGQKKDKQRMVNVETSMPGRIVKILLKEGDRVEEGQAVLILEAMKMQNEIKSPQAGKITKIGPKAGDSVETGAVLFAVG
jgi:biotin carboxyl carrier protein